MSHVLEMRISAQHHHTHLDYHNSASQLRDPQHNVLNVSNLVTEVAAWWLSGQTSYDHNIWVGPIIFTRRANTHREEPGRHRVQPHCTGHGSKYYSSRVIYSDKKTDIKRRKLLVDWFDLKTLARLRCASPGCLHATDTPGLSVKTYSSPRLTHHYVDIGRRI